MLALLCLREVDANAVLLAAPFVANVPREERLGLLRCVDKHWFPECAEDWLVLFVGRFNALNLRLAIRIPGCVCIVFADVRMMRFLMRSPPGEYSSSTTASVSILVVHTK